MIKPILILLIFALTITAISRHLLAVEKEYSMQLQDETEQLHFTHQFKQFALTNTGDNGDTQSVIHSPTTRVLTEKQQTLMENARIVMYREQEPPVIITADHAQVLHADKQTLLQDNVIVTLPDSHNNNTVMTTEQLTLDNQTHAAKTDLPATIVHGKGNMNGTGVEFNPHSKQIKFLNNVRGIYEQ